MLRLHLILLAVNVEECQGYVLHWMLGIVRIFLRFSKVQSRVIMAEMLRNANIC